MNNNNQNEFNEISREKRIMLRVKRYIAGELSLDDFAALERLDEMTEESMLERASAQATRLRELHEADKAKAAPKKFTMTKEEFTKLKLAEQAALYDEYPEEVEALIKGD